VDEVAERILMLSGTPAHNFSEFLKVSAIKDRLATKSKSRERDPRLTESADCSGT
jgi:DNA-binding ferritin-like protein